MGAAEVKRVHLPGRRVGRKFGEWRRWLLRVDHLLCLMSGAEGAGIGGAGEGAVPLSPAVSCRLGSFREQIDDSHRLVARWTQSTHTYALAEGSAVTAVLFAEVAGFAGLALVDRAMPRSTRWDRRKWSRVTASPRLLAAGRRTKALSADQLELGPADDAAPHRRLAIVTQREFSVHGHCLAPECRVVRRPCRP
jgi:hypothetical protein